ncbi:hypothetical protein D9611_009047 [Ephemerocybe angulata]|uniref:Retrovirus-related Pol polyprotein from transposon TNT 1-94-like beta-barrel domain-containing protein n=1 Tax=Ephemerocybe angulata TaxID=980116 RepID=A0A8H5CE87_9AGAR|nr:hypothetical protein D9611_009047 [Tulosesus angulatus]
MRSSGRNSSNPWVLQRPVEEGDDDDSSSSRSHSPGHEGRPWTNVTRRPRGRVHQRSHVTFEPSTSTPRSAIFPHSPHPAPSSLFENPFRSLEVEEDDSFYASEDEAPAHGEQVRLEDVPAQEEAGQQSDDGLDVKLEELEAGHVQGEVMGGQEGASRGVHEEESQGSLAMMHEGLALPSHQKQSPLPSQWGLPPPQYFQGGWRGVYNQPNVHSPHHQTSAYGMWSQPQQSSTGAPYGGVPSQPQPPTHRQPAPPWQPAPRQRPPLPQPPQQYAQFQGYQPQVQQQFGFAPANNPYAPMYPAPAPGFAPQYPGYPGGYPAPPGPGGYGQQLPVGYPIHAQRKQPSTDKAEALKGSANYAVWSAWALELVTSLGLLSHVSRSGDPFLRVTQQPSYPPPAANAATNPVGAWTYEEWWLDDDLVHYVVTSRLEPSIATSVPRVVTMANGAQAKATSRDVWNYLYRTYGAGQITTTLSAWSKATSKTFTTERLHEVEAYILEFRRAYDAMVVAGQSVSYESVHVTLADALPDVGGIASLVREFRASADAQTADHPHVALEKVQLEVSNYLAKHPRSIRSNNSNNNNNRKTSSNQSSGGARNRPWCETCNNSGHWTRLCFQRGGAMEGKKEEALKLSSEEAKKARAGRQGGQGGGSSGGGSRQGVAAAGVGATSGEAGDAPPTDGPGRDVNLAGVLVDTQRNVNEFECYVETAMLVDKEKAKLFPPGCEYLLDSGCTSHLINDRNAFWDFEDVPTHSMTTANCGSLPTRGRGTIKLSLAGAASDGSDLVLVMKRALYSPDAPCSLVSVGTLQEKGVGIEYLPAPVDETYIRFGSLTPWEGLSVKASRLGKLSFIPATIKYPPRAADETTLDEPSVVAAATSDDATVADELRALRDLSMDETALTAASAKTPTPHRWHERLGHLGRDRTKQFLTGTYATGITYSGPFEDKICPPCVVGKGARAPIPNPGNRATKPLERLHIDICGPHEVMSLSASRRGRFKYWLVILDDYTNYGFVALLPDRSSTGVLAAFTKATARWELLTGEKVKCVRMDGAKESRV